jgi:hypothetical protein
MLTRKILGFNPGGWAAVKKKFENFKYLLKKIFLDSCPEHEKYKILLANVNGTLHRIFIIQIRDAGSRFKNWLTIFTIKMQRALANKITENDAIGIP